MSEVTPDPRYRNHLEAQLAQLDEQRRADNEVIRRYVAEITPLRAKIAHLQPLAEAAADHRDAAKRCAEEAKALATKLAAAENRIAGLEELLDDADAKIARLEGELTSYDALNARVAKAEALSDLFPS